MPSTTGRDRPRGVRPYRDRGLDHRAAGRRAARLVESRGTAGRQSLDHDARDSCRDRSARRAEKIRDTLRIIAQCVGAYRKDRKAKLHRADVLALGLSEDRAARFQGAYCVSVDAVGLPSA
jgi:hypothetical protein